MRLPVLALLAAPWIATAPVAAQTTSTLPEYWSISPSGEFDAEFGSYVDVAGDTVVIGAPRADGTSADSGSVFVYRNVGGTTWVLEQEIRSPHDWTGRRFGVPAIDGDTLVVMAQGDRAQTAPSLYLYTRTGTTWTYQDEGGALGTSGAALSGTTALGARRLQRIVGTQLVFETNLDDPDAYALDGDVDIDGDTILFGDPRDWSSPGRVFVFARNGSTWTREAILAAPHGGHNDDRFGDAVAIDGDVAIVGADEYNGAAPRCGGAFVFGRTGTTWALESVLTPPVPVEFGGFGTHVALDGDRAAVTTDAYDAARVYTYVRIGTEWALETELSNPLSHSFDNFGASLAVDGDLAVVGAPGFQSQGLFLVYRQVELENEPFCFSAESATPCPCGNVGAPGRGCDNPQGTGGTRFDVEAFTPDGLGGGRATAVGTSFPIGSSPTVVLIRSPGREDPPQVFGDGLRCIRLNGFARVGVTTAARGASRHPINHGAGPGRFYYQLWYRSNPGHFCAPEAFNLSNAVSLHWR